MSANEDSLVPLFSRLRSRLLTELNLVPNPRLIPIVTYISGIYIQHIDSYNIQHPFQDSNIGNTIHVQYRSHHIHIYTDIQTCPLRLDKNFSEIRQYRHYAYGIHHPALPRRLSNIIRLWINFKTLIKMNYTIISSAFLPMTCTYIINSSKYILCISVRLIAVQLQIEASHTHLRAHQTQDKLSLHIHFIFYFLQRGGVYVSEGSHRQRCVQRKVSRSGKLLSSNLGGGVIIVCYYWNGLD